MHKSFTKKANRILQNDWIEDPHNSDRKSDLSLLISGTMESLQTKRARLYMAQSEATEAARRLNACLTDRNVIGAVRLQKVYAVLSEMKIRIHQDIKVGKAIEVLMS